VVTIHNNALLILFPTVLHTKQRTPKQHFIQTHETLNNNSNFKPNKEETKKVLVKVALVVEHGEWDDEEDEDGVEDVNGEPELLHGKSEVASPVVDRVAAGLAVRHVRREHEDGDGGDGEAQNDDEFREVGLVGVIRMLVVDQEVHVDEEHDHADHHRHDHQGEVEIAHLSSGEIRGIARLGIRVRVRRISFRDRERENKRGIWFRSGGGLLRLAVVILM